MKKTSVLLFGESELLVLDQQLEHVDVTYTLQDRAKMSKGVRIKIKEYLVTQIDIPTYNDFMQSNISIIEMLETGVLYRYGYIGNKKYSKKKTNVLELQEKLPKRTVFFKNYAENPTIEISEGTSFELADPVDVEFMTISDKIEYVWKLRKYLFNISEKTKLIFETEDEEEINNSLLEHIDSLEKLFITKVLRKM